MSSLIFGRRTPWRTVAGSFLTRILLDNQKVAPRTNIHKTEKKNSSFQV